MLTSANPYSPLQGLGFEATVGLEAEAGVILEINQKTHCGRHVASLMGKHEKIQVQITQEDIRAWGYPAQHPLAEALRRATHTDWRLVDSIMLVEKVAPFRSVFICSELLLKLHDCKNGEHILPLACEIELMSPFDDVLPFND